MPVTAELAWLTRPEVLVSADQAKPRRSVYAVPPALTRTRAGAVACDARLLVKVADPSGMDAVMVAVLLAVTTPAVATKATEVEPADTVTEAGWDRVALSSERVTRLPPLGAARFRVTVQVEAPLDGSVAGRQLKLAGAVGATRFSRKLSGAPERVASNVAVASAVTLRAFTENVAEVLPAPTVTEDWTESSALLLASVIVLPEAGATLSRVMVQVPLAPETSVAGLQLKFVREGGGTKLTVKLAETPFPVALMVAVLSAVTAEVEA